MYSMYSVLQLFEWIKLYNHISGTHFHQLSKFWELGWYLKINILISNKNFFSFILLQFHNRIVLSTELSAFPKDTDQSADYT